MTIEARNNFIVALRRKGWSMNRIAAHKKINLSVARVRQLLRAILPKREYNNLKLLVQRAA